MVAVREPVRAERAAVWLLVAVGVGFWLSLYSAARAGLDSVLGLAPAVVPLAVLSGWLAYRRDRSVAAPPREGFADAIAGLAPIAAALWLEWLGPSSLGWRFWAERRDLIAVELFALGAACWIFGLAAMWRMRAAILVLAIGSPMVLAWLQEHFAPPLALLTSGLARPVVTALGVHLAPTQDPTVFAGVSRAGGPYRIIIADVCSGLASWLSVILVGIPASLYLGLGGWRTAGWLAAGLVLATVANLARVVALLVVADRAGPRFALADVHPFLGLVLLAVVFAVLFFVPRATSLPVASWELGVSRFGMVAVAIAALISAAGQTRLLPYQALPASGAVGPDVATPLEVAPKLPGWTAEWRNEINWQDLFGADSQSYLLMYTSAQHVAVTAQLVATPDVGSLLTYTPERCGVYHGEQVRGERAVNLGLGQVGYLVDSTDQVPADRARPSDGRTRPLRFSVLYWYVPYTVGGQSWTARFLLILDSDVNAALPPLPAS
ncbi:MAG: exosortase/archaeosortase family protein, partial [Chloroflexota bacterium]